MSLVTELSSDFPNRIRSRGSDYFTGKAVRIISGDAWHVDARVQGTENYIVRLFREDDMVLVKCSCPYFETDGACKHLWAVLLTADEKGYLKGDGRKTPLVLVEDYDDDEEFFDDPDDDDDDEDYDDADVIENLRSAIAQLTPQTNRNLGWKEQLAAMGLSAQSAPQETTQAWPENRQLIYIIDIPGTLSSQNLILELQFQDMKKDGEWGRPRTLRFYRHQITEMPGEADRQILASLAGSREQADYNPYGYGYNDSYDYVPNKFRLAPPLPQILVPLIARTGRCYLRMEPGQDILQPIEWDEGGAWKFQVEIEPKGEDYEVKGALRRGEEEMDLAAPLLTIGGGLIFSNDRISLLDDGHAFQWAAMLRRSGSLNVPSAQIGDFVAEILSSPILPPLKLPEALLYEETVAQPRPTLIVRAPDKTRHAYYDRLHGHLSFDYAPGKPDGSVAADDKRKGVYLPDLHQFVIRDKESEKSARMRLTQLGFRHSPPTYYQKQEQWEIASKKLPRIVRELVKEGWHVEAEGKVFRSAGEINVSVSSGIDWFELHGSIDFGGATAKLPALLAAVKRGENVVSLDDGTFGMLPEEWLKKYGLLAGLGESRDDHLRFRKSQVGVLDALLASQPEARFDESFARARNELKKFEGIKPADPPSGFIGELRPYQKDGLGWMDFLRRFGFGGCLADDMGLGKTVQVLALLEARRQAGQKNGAGKKRRLAPTLAVVPKSLVFNWKQEAAKFSPQLKVLDHTGQFRQKGGEHFEDYDLILTTYGTLRNDAIVFKDLRFDYIILDEAQAIKNADTASAKAARLLQGDNRLALSGTPVENHLGELWSLFEFLNPGMLGAASVFKLTGLGARNPDEETRKMLSQALRPFILRRTKDQVAKDLPPKLEQTLFCELEPRQRKLYDELRDHYRNTLLDRIARDGIAKSKIHVLEALLRLRQAACHPGLIDKKRINEPSAKLDMLVPQLAELFEENHKVLVFSQFTSFLAILKEQLDKQKISYEYLDGKTRDRQARVEKFQNDPACKLFLISLKAGGLGLNLTAAEYVYLLDPWWNPAVEAQAIDRAHRIGQTQQVFAYRIIAQNTVEEKVLALQNTKRDLADAIINADNSLIRGLAREDLELLLS